MNWNPIPSVRTLAAASAAAVLVSLSASAGTFDFSGSSALDGVDGNIRSFTSDGVTVNASAFSRTTSGTWSTAYLGLYSSGLGVTDPSEGGGGNGLHRVDNVGRLNYVLFEFSQSVVVDQAYLASVVDDSDISVWIGTFTDPLNNHLALTDALLGSFGSSEINTTTSGGSRWANINAGNAAGNALVIAAWTGDTSPEDRFKISKLDIDAVSVPEPGSLAGMGAAALMGGVGLARRRRRGAAVG